MPRKSRRKAPPPSPPPNPPPSPTTRQQSARGRSNAPAVASQPKKRKQEPEKKEYVGFVRKKDVLAGKGQGANAHKGNIEFRRFLRSHLDRYTLSSKREKTTLCEELIRLYRVNHGVRFLEKDPENNRWFHLSNHTARSKASQYMQDTMKAERKRRAKSNPEANADELQFDEEAHDSAKLEFDLGAYLEEPTAAMHVPGLSPNSGAMDTAHETLHDSITRATFAVAREKSEEEAIAPPRRPEAQLRPARVSHVQLHEIERKTAFDSKSDDSLRDSDASY
jgi:hypothetical protein